MPVTKTTTISLGVDDIAVRFQGARRQRVTVETATAMNSDIVSYMRIWQGDDGIFMSPESIIRLRDTLTAHLLELGL